MFEKVNPSHPDKVADRIAGAIVDLAYKKQDNPKVAVEVLVGHGYCHITGECSNLPSLGELLEITDRIIGHRVNVDANIVPQDTHLADNQKTEIRCGDNGIFRGCPDTGEQAWLTGLARDIYERHPTDGKYMIVGQDVTICQSHASTEALKKELGAGRFRYKINPLGDWTGGIDVDTGATNRKLGSDMGDAVTGGGLHGKDLSKADITLNIYAHIKAQKYNRPVDLSCSIGDNTVDGRPYSEIVEMARAYINQLGGFEKFAEWGIIR